MTYSLQQKVFIARASAAQSILRSAVNEADIEVVLTMEEAKMALGQIKALNNEISKLWDLLPEADKDRLSEEMWGDHKREQEQVIKEEETKHE